MKSTPSCASTAVVTSPPPASARDRPAHHHVDVGEQGLQRGRLKTCFAVVQNAEIRERFNNARCGMVDSVSPLGLEATRAAYANARMAAGIAIPASQP
jgi:hypothetical protein